MDNIFGNSNRSGSTPVNKSNSSSASASLDDRPTSGMEQLIPVINKLQDVFSTLGSDPLDLPQIAVIGTQSAGKSSVLEHVVGRDFLPRGSGIVTRRPLVLQLITVPRDTSREEKFSEWGEFLHKPNEMFYDFEEIRNEISRETDRLTGRNKGISPMPINLKIYSPHVLNLTLVDLPGITRIPIGDQPKDIEHQIRAMLLNYIERKNCIILAVSPANTDLTTSDSLQLAREVDPQGMRTLGVITKIDLMDRGTDALDMLLGRVHPLRLGYIGVINRSQQDIQAKKSIRDAVKAEENFFNGHPLYRTIASRAGTLYLSRQLNKILLNHIRNTIPELKTKINKMIAEAQGELSAFGDPVNDTKNGQGALLLQIITKFTTDYRNAIDGRSTIETNELYGGARINYIFMEVFGRHVNLIGAGEGVTEEDIRTSIRNATGPKAGLFVPESAFEMLVKRQIARLEEPALSCVDQVFDELQGIVANLEVKELQRFTGLKDRMIEVVNRLLAKCRSPTKLMISNLVFIELAYINTNHPDFIGGDGAVAEIFARMARSSESDQMSQLQQQQLQLQQQQLQMQQQQQLQQQQQNNTPIQNVNQIAQGATQLRNQMSTAKNGAGGDSNYFSMIFNNQAGGNKGAAASAQKPVASTSSTAVTRTNPTTTTSTKASKPAPLAPLPTVIKANSKPSEKESFETELIKSLILSYFDVVKKNVMDLVPKSIMHFLVNQSKETMQNELVAELYREELLDELLEESDGTAERRKTVKAMLINLQKANSILNEVRDTTVQ